MGKIYDLSEINSGLNMEEEWREKEDVKKEEGFESGDPKLAKIMRDRYGSDAGIAMKLFLSGKL